MPKGAASRETGNENADREQANDNIPVVNDNAPVDKKARRNALARKRYARKKWRRAYQRKYMKEWRRKLKLIKGEAK